MAGKKHLLDAKQAMWAWNPGSDQVCVVPWPDVKNLSGSYGYTAGACCAFVALEMTPEQIEQYVVGEALKLMVRDQCQARAVHSAFSGIREYWDFLAGLAIFDDWLWDPDLQKNLRSEGHGK